ncbi:MAG: N-methyl-L-tryptophan oxidase [Trueperaceae bacterium]|nr:MAG: N-methyl-L-tryptophan oxidase [Trueperaceae bacterium]
MSHYDFIIIGAGVAGSAATYHLAKEHRVLLLEQFEFQHVRGSSHGDSRIFRHAYEDIRYVKLAVAADEAWRELERLVDDKLLYRTGGIDIGHEDDPALANIEKALQDQDCPFETFTPNRLAQPFPAFELKRHHRALYQADAGILAATRCLGAMQRLAVSRGATLLEREEVTDIDLDAPVEVKTQAGRYTAEGLIVTAGPWLKGLLKDLELPLSVERQQVLYLEVEDGPIFGANRFPIFIYRHENRAEVYGFPRFEHPTAIKVADHANGTEIDLEQRHFDLDSNKALETTRLVQEILPKVTSKRVRFQTCLYTKTPDNHFILGRHPLHPNVVIGGGFSGHGFKFGPILGEILAELARQGRSRHDLSLFEPNRFVAGRVDR